MTDLENFEALFRIVGIAYTSGTRNIAALSSCLPLEAYTWLSIEDSLSLLWFTKEGKALGAQITADDGYQEWRAARRKEAE